jgi:hypothetical protein
MIFILQRKDSQLPGEYSQTALEAHFRQINDRLAKIEAQLTTLSDTAGVPYERPLDEVPEDVVELARAGKTLEAVKRYRELTNANMDRAMEVVSGL